MGEKSLSSVETSSSSSSSSNDFPSRNSTENRVEEGTESSKVLKVCPSKEPDFDKLKMVGDYVIGKKLGEGTFGKVKLGTHYITNQKVALKFIEHKNASEKALQNIQREVRIMKLLDHQNIVKFYDVFELPERNLTILILEYINGGELFDYIVANRRLKEKEAAKFFGQMICALEYCHNSLVIHRDLKPENLLLDSDKNIKINDFGLSNVMKPGFFFQTSCGSPLYSSPEILMETNYVGPEVDVWSMGVILFAMVCGYIPWEGNDMRSQVNQAMKAKFNVPDYVSPECNHLIHRMLTVDRHKRATLSELREHPWVKNVFIFPPLAVRPVLTMDSIDQSILIMLETLGFDKYHVITELIERKTTSQDYIMYYLILDQKNKHQVMNNSQQSSQPQVHRHHRHHHRHHHHHQGEEEKEKQQQQSQQMHIEEKSPHKHPEGKESFIISEISELDSKVSGSNESNSDGKEEKPEKDSERLSASLGNYPEVSRISPPVRIPNENDLRTAEIPDSSPKKASKSIFHLFKKEHRPSNVSRRLSIIEKIPLPPEHENVTANIISGNLSKTVGYEKTFVQSEEESLQLVGGAFKVETTTTKALKEIHEEIQRVLTMMNIEFKKKKKAIYKCKFKPMKLKFELQICRIIKLEGVKGLKFKRIAGDVWNYMSTYQLICKQFKL